MSSNCPGSDKKEKKTGILKTTKFAVQQTLVEPQEVHTGESEKRCSSIQSKALVERKLTRLDQPGITSV